MTTTMTPAAQLARLPEPIQAELWALTRCLIGMSQDERLAAIRAVTDATEAAFVRAEWETVQVLNAVGQVVTQVDHAAYPRTSQEGVV